MSGKTTYHLAPAFACLDMMIQREVSHLRGRRAPSESAPGQEYASDAQAAALALLRVEAQSDPMSADVLRSQSAAISALDGYRPTAVFAQVLGLSVFARLVTFFALAPVLHDKYAALFAYLNDDLAKPYLTQGLCLRLAGLPADDAQRWHLTPDSPLFELGVLDQIAQLDDGAIPQGLDGGLRLSQDAARFLLNAPAIGNLKRLTDCRPGDIPVPEAIAAKVTTAAQLLTQHPVAVSGPQGSGRSAIALSMLGGNGRHYCDVALNTMSPQELSKTLLTARLYFAGVILRDLPDALHPTCREAVHRFANEGRAVLIIAQTEQEAQKLLPDATVIQMPTLSVSDCHRIWVHALAHHGLQAEDKAVWSVSDLFALSWRDIDAAAGNLAVRKQMGDAALDQRALARVARAHSVVGFGHVAQRVQDFYAIDDLVVPDLVRARIEGFIAATQVRSTVWDDWGMRRRLGPGRGLAALFTGASGTGKSMAASVIAKQLGLDLYRVELSGVVSKYIGETEKSLDRVFEAARAANCILFFDEAEALFGKRSEVKDAHDRYANIECAYLLQKMERHDGIVIMTTNMGRSLDTAFSRRIQFVIDFPRPDSALRERLWRGAFGPDVPLSADFDPVALAQSFDNTGGEIRNIALDAALQAARSQDRKVTMHGILAAVERQMLKQGRAPTAAMLKHARRLPTAAE